MGAIHHNPSNDAFIAKLKMAVYSARVFRTVGCVALAIAVMILALPHGKELFGDARGWAAAILALMSVIGVSEHHHAQLLVEYVRRSELAGHALVSHGDLTARPTGSVRAWGMLTVIVFVVVGFIIGIKVFRMALP